jgi:hypothetical protein
MSSEGVTTATQLSPTHCRRLDKNVISAEDHRKIIKIIHLSSVMFIKTYQLIKKKYRNSSRKKALHITGNEINWLVNCNMDWKSGKCKSAM